MNQLKFKSKNKSKFNKSKIKVKHKKKVQSIKRKITNLQVFRDQRKNNFVSKLFNSVSEKST